MIGVLSRNEVAALQSYAEGLVVLSQQWLSGCQWVEGGVRGSGRLVSDRPVHDERIAAIVRDHAPAGAADWELAWWAPECLSDTVDAARRVVATLPESGAVVVLERVQDVDAWCRLIGDVLAVLHPYRQGSLDDSDETATRAEAWLESLLGPLLVGSTAL